jgi:hypothetical protein
MGNLCCNNAEFLDDYDDYEIAIIDIEYNVPVKSLTRKKMVHFEDEKSINTKINKQSVSESNMYDNYRIV